MTTQAFTQTQRFRSAAITAVKQEHCSPPAYRPAARVQDTMPCPKCGHRLNFTVSAESGLTTGRCTTAGCISWTE